MGEGGLQEELGEVVLLGSWQTGAGVRARVTELTRSHLVTAKTSCARRQKEMHVEAAQEIDTRKGEEAGAGHICTGTGHICTGSGMARPHSWEDRTGGSLTAPQLLLVLKPGSTPTTLCSVSPEKKPGCTG